MIHPSLEKNVLEGRLNPLGVSFTSCCHSKALGTNKTLWLGIEPWWTLAYKSIPWETHYQHSPTSETTCSRYPPASKYRQRSPTSDYLQSSISTSRQYKSAKIYRRHPLTTQRSHPVNAVWTRHFFSDRGRRTFDGLSDDRLFITTLTAYTNPRLFALDWSPFTVYF